MRDEHKSWKPLRCAYLTLLALNDVRMLQDFDKHDSTSSKCGRSLGKLLPPKSWS